MAEFDMDAGLASVSEGLGFDNTEAEDATIVNDPALEKAVDGAVDATTTSVAPPAAPPVAPLPPTDPAPPPATPAVEPPKTWRPAAAAKFSSADPEIQAEILKREEDMHKGLEQYKGDASFGKTIKQVLDPYLPIMRQHNVDPVAQIGGLMQAHQTLALGTPEQKVALFTKLATDYGIDLKNLPTEQAWVDPEVKRLRDELNGVKSTLSAGETARQQAAVNEQKAAIEAFAADPANVHFAAVLSDMVELTSKGAATSLKDAYDKAVWLNPVTRAAEIARQQTEISAKVQAGAEAKAAAAKAATAANVKSRAKGGSATTPLGSMDDTMQAALDKIRARG